MSSATPKLLVDASVAIKWTLPVAREPDAAIARALIGERDLATTTLALYEIANTIGRIHPGKAAAAIESCALVAAVCGDAEALTAPDIARAAQLAEQHGITFYDASYAAIAERTGWPLVSVDRHLLGPGLAIGLTEALSG